MILESTKIKMSIFSKGHAKSMSSYIGIESEISRHRKKFTSRSTECGLPEVSSRAGIKGPPMGVYGSRIPQEN